MRRSPCITPRSVRCRSRTLCSTIVVLIAMVFPGVLRDAVQCVAGRRELRSHRIAARIEQLREVIDREHECVGAFGNPKGWLALFWAVFFFQAEDGIRDLIVTGVQ